MERSFRVRGARRWAPRAAVVALLTSTLAMAAPATAASPPPLSNDPLLPLQWQLGRSDAIGAAGAEAPARGAVTVAVIDTGMDLDHPDLKGNLWVNFGEVPGNGQDDDGNGYVDDVHGYDFVNGDGSPSDDNGHGTAVTGVLAARVGNRLGIAGVAGRPGIRVMALKALDSNNSGNAATIAPALRYAVANGARVVNVSINGRDPSQPLQDAIAAAREAGVLVVASAGNGGNDLDQQPSYPASYSDDNVIAVGSIGADGELSGFSNRGQRVDEVAPGERIMSTTTGGGYGSGEGTSLAAAQVSGALALLALAHPQAPASSLRAALLAGSRPADLAATPRARVLDLQGALDALDSARSAAGGSVRTAARSRRRVAARLRQILRLRRANARQGVRGRTH